MVAIKRVICSERVRKIPTQFSWVDHRLVRERHIERCDAHAAALYLFLVTVADAQGLSYYSDASLGRSLSTDPVRLSKARGDLIRAGLIAYPLAFDRYSAAHHSRKLNASFRSEAGIAASPRHGPLLVDSRRTESGRMRPPSEINIGFLVDRLTGKRYATHAPLSYFRSPSCLSPQFPKMAKS